MSILSTKSKAIWLSAKILICKESSNKPFWQTGVALPVHMGNFYAHSQKKQLIQLYIFISKSFELPLYSWIAGLHDDIQWSELFLLRVHVQFEQGTHGIVSTILH